MEYLKVVGKEDVYKIIVPLITIILGWVFQYINGFLFEERQWKQIREKSQVERYINYMLIIVGFGGFILAAYVFLVASVEVLFSIQVTIGVIKVSYLMVSGVSFCYLIFSEQKRQFVESKQKNLFLQKIPCILSGLLWCFIFTSKAVIFMRISAIIIFALEIYVLFFLSDIKDFKYKYAKFHFYSGKTIDLIETKSISQKRNWIIINGESTGVEHRFRIKDIEKIEYKH